MTILTLFVICRKRTKTAPAINHGRHSPNKHHSYSSHAPTLLISPFLSWRVSKACFRREKKLGNLHSAKGAVRLRSVHVASIHKTLVASDTALLPPVHTHMWPVHSAQPSIKHFWLGTLRFVQLDTKNSCFRICTPTCMTYCK